MECSPSRLISMGCSSFCEDDSPRGESSVGNLGDKLRELLLLSGLDLNLCPDSDEVNQLFAGNYEFIDWFSTSLKADNIVLEDEIQNYEEQNSKGSLLEEKEVDKLLEKKFGVGMNCVRLCPETLEKRLIEESLLRSKINFITTTNTALNTKEKKLEADNARINIDLKQCKQEEIKLRSDCQKLIEDIKINLPYVVETRLPPLSALYMEKIHESDFKCFTEEDLLNVYSEIPTLLDSIRNSFSEMNKVFVILSASPRPESLIVDKCESDRTLSVLGDVECLLAKLLPYLDHRGYVLKEMFLRILSSKLKFGTTRMETVLDIVNVENPVSNQKQSENLSDFLFSIYKNLVGSDEVVTVDDLISVLTSVDLEIQDGQILLVNYMRHLNTKLVSMINSMENLGFELIKESEYKIPEVSLIKQIIVKLHNLISIVSSNKKKENRRTLIQHMWLCLQQYENFLSVMNEMKSKIQILHKAIGP